MPRLGSTLNPVKRRNMKATLMADHPHQDLETLIQRQMGAQQPGNPRQNGFPVSGPYLWMAIGQELRRARSVLARTRTTSEMEAAAARLRERLLGEAAASAVVITSMAGSMAESAKA